ncbi:hypothetical protein Q5P01_015208 [Channa striata]|uniref:Uncharacterized protein n=1 Tax=Channa striata TaxID=64152 RepID=A0AA88SHJ1_CHASR|nr:hypothetical protein Q5P01_015208 [Channa striata]
MVHGKKLVKETLLLSVLEDGDEETESEKLLPEEHKAARTEVDTRGPKDQHSKPDGNVLDRGESEDKGKLYDPTGRTCYMEACERLQVVPVPYFLRHMQDNELSMMYYGLGPQGTKALAVPLVTNTSILRLNLRDNWMEGMGGAAIAEMLKENCYITEVDLSDNNLGDRGARAIAAMLKENSTLVSLNLSGNHFTTRSAEHLGPALITNTKLQHSTSATTLWESTQDKHWGTHCQRTRG